MTDSNGPQPETYSPWTVVNVVFHHLVDVGLHPTLGRPGIRVSQPQRCCARWASCRRSRVMPENPSRGVSIWPSFGQR